MEGRKLTGTREHMDKVADLVATAMGVARLIGKPKVREKYLGGAEFSLLLLGKVLEESALEVEAIIDWDEIDAACMTRRGETNVQEVDGAACGVSGNPSEDAME